MATRPPDPSTLRLNADIPNKLHFEFKKACLNNQETMTDVLTRFIAKYVELTRSKSK